MWLSKSKLKQGLQCSKALWLAVHQKHLTKYSASTQKAFSVGNDVGAEARTYFPGGKLIKAYSLIDKIKLSRQELKGTTTLFEAAFEYREVPIQVDVLEAVTGGWNLIEVKSATSFKEDYLQDVAIQYYVLRGLNVPIQKIYLWFINRETPDRQNLFTKQEISVEQMQPWLDQLPGIVQNFQALLANKQMPSVDIGSHCQEPYECPFKDFCWHRIPKTGSIFQLPNFSRKWEAYQAGVISLDDPRVLDYGVNPEVVNAIKENRMWINRTAIREILTRWQFPLSVLDFETFQDPLNNYPRCRPYQQIPFQFSLQCLTAEDAEPVVYDYLHQVNSDPRPALAKALSEAAPTSGTVLAYNKKFEEKILLELAEAFPEYAESLKSLAARLEDPWLVLREHLYHPDFNGSYSLKAVVPALLGKDRAYANLAVQNGLAAQAQYFKLIKSSQMLEKITLNQEMRDYCNADTFNLILLYRFLRHETR